MELMAFRCVVVNRGMIKPWLLVGLSTCSAALGLGVVTPTPNEGFVCALATEAANKAIK
jgi:hypothetical protein